MPKTHFLLLVYTKHYQSVWVGQKKLKCLFFLIFWSKFVYSNWSWNTSNLFEKVLFKAYWKFWWQFEWHQKYNTTSVFRKDLYGIIVAKWLQFFGFSLPLLYRDLYCLEKSSSEPFRIAPLVWVALFTLSCEFSIQQPLWHCVLLCGGRRVGRLLPFKIFWWDILIFSNGASY